MNVWVQQLRKGLAEFGVLAVLEQEDMHGYAVLQRLALMPTMALTESAVYPLLSRLREGGFIESRMEKSLTGPPKRIYTLTAPGRERLAAMRGYWMELCGDLNHLNGGKLS